MARMGPLVGMVILSLALTTKQPVAQEILLEIDINDGGNILEVRGEKGEVFEQIPFEGISGFDLLLTKSLLLGEVSAEAMRCCKRSGRWYSCAELEFAGRSSTVLINGEGEVARVDGFVDGEWRENLQPHDPGEQAPMKSAEIHSLQSHVIAVVEKEGARHGMVISADGDSSTGHWIWYDQSQFK